MTYTLTEEEYRDLKAKSISRSEYDKWVVEVNKISQATMQSIIRIIAEDKDASAPIKTRESLQVALFVLDKAIKSLVYPEYRKES